MNDWKNIKNIPAFAAELEKLKKQYRAYNSAPMPTLTEELFGVYYRTGSRKEYETVYFYRRGMLTNYALMCFIFGDRYISELTRVIESICREKTWALPPHVPEDCAAPAEVIDLFSAETAQALGQICDILGRRLPEKYHALIKKEVERRIFIPFLTHDFGWESMDNNWAAVCAGSVGMAVLYLFPEKFGAIEKRLLNAIKAYFSGFGDDGISPEGLGYWDYGMRYFTGFADLYRQRCGVDLFDDPKVRTAARCQQSLFLHGGDIISFSDCVRGECFDTPLAHYLRGVYGGDIKLIKKGISYSADPCNRFLPAASLYLWTNPEWLDIEEGTENEQYFKDCEWYVNCRPGFAFAAKCGNNGESHNHNDVGGFILSRNGEQLIADYGAGEYTKDYFSDRRYTLLCNSSRGHSVPAIDGNYQCGGREYRGCVLRQGKDEFMADIAGAYDVAELKRAVRHFKIEQNGVRLTDSFEFTDKRGHKIIERFVSLKEPCILDGKVLIEDMMIECNVSPKISSEMLKAHDGTEDVLYFVDYEVQDSFSARFYIEYQLIKNRRTP